MKMSYWPRISQTTNFLLRFVYSPKAQEQEGPRTLTTLFFHLLSMRESKDTLLGSRLTFFLVFTELSRPSLCKIPPLTLNAGCYALVSFKEGNIRHKLPQPELFQNPIHVAPTGHRSHLPQRRDCQLAVERRELCSGHIAHSS